MGNPYGFVELGVLLMLQKKGSSRGYDLYAELQEQALTDAEIDKGALTEPSGRRRRTAM